MRFRIWLVLICVFSLCITGFSQDLSEYVSRAWGQSGEKNFKELDAIVSEALDIFQEEADKIASKLGKLPPKGEENLYKVMNEVATLYFIKGESLMRQGKDKEAIEVFNFVIEKYPFAQAFDPRGWFWSVKEKAIASLCKLDPESKFCKVEIVKPAVITNIILSDHGSEFPVNYEKYGEFISEGTGRYIYKVNNQEGLIAACGEGVFPNTTSFRYDPRFVEVKKKLYKVDHWKLLNSRDLNLAFYKWNVCGEPWGVKQFYIADLLERSGQIQQAIKAYYAIVVHFPSSYAWTYWHTPWYVALAAIDRIEYLLGKHPELGLKLEGVSIDIVNGFDHNINNDVFIVNPGKFVKKTLLNIFERKKSRRLGRIVKSVGSKVKLVKYESGDWQLFVGKDPFVIRGITYSPTRVGESPDDRTLNDWMSQDINNNGTIDGPFEAWVDRDKDSIKDPGEMIEGDFKLLRDMGVNCIRVYQQPFKPDKKLLRRLYDEYGIMVIMGDFLGKYAIGSGASWTDGTDYSNAEHQQNMLKSVTEMLSEYKDEPYILMWLLGNENVYGVACNADKDPESFFKFTNTVAKHIKEIDPTRPVAVASGDVLYLDIFGRECEDVDIFGTNAYRGKYGFGSFWKDVKDHSAKAAMITEYGCSSFAKGYSEDEAETFQAEYHEGNWEDIAANFSGLGQGNSLGGIVFEYLDEWWKAYEPGIHDTEGLFTGPFLDGFMHEEWLGICGQGDGEKSPFLRQLKKSYFTYKDLWNK